MKRNKGHRGDLGHDSIKSHLVSDDRHDPYRARTKLADPTLCPDCGAVFKDGRWQWADAPGADAPRESCPACRRIKDAFPAGEVTLSGSFLAAHRDEILARVRHVAEDETREHPLERLMTIEVQGDGSERLTTTGIHLPRRIGHALESAFKGSLETHYDEAGHFARVAWRRDA